MTEQVAKSNKKDKQTQHPQFEERLKALPEKPGIYIMRDALGTIIYVGKALSLKSRVRSYFQSLRDQPPKVRKMVSHIADFEFIVTNTEMEAFLLEMNYIKLHHPRYNIIMRDDKSYPYLKVTTNDEWPQVIKVRRVTDDGAKYFGPFAGNGTAWHTLNVIQKIFPLRTCNKVIDGKDPRPCLDYYIHRCLGPCASLADKQEYKNYVDQVVMFLEGKQSVVADQLRGKMEEAAENLEFERAALLRDQLKAIEQVVERQKIITAGGSDEDVIAFAQDSSDIVVQMFFIRSGKMLGHEHYQLQGTEDETPSEILTSFLQQYYSDASSVPPRLILQHEVEEQGVIEAWLKEKRGSKVDIYVPKRGEKRELIEMAVQNAKQTLEQARLKWLSDEQKTTAALTDLQKYLELSGWPKRIECYDISNIQGTNSVASMVVFENGQPKKSEYRRFKIKTVEGPNDFASMAEVITRRFRRALDDEDTAAGGVPLESRSEAIAREFAHEDGLLSRALLETTEGESGGPLTIVEDSPAKTPLTNNNDSKASHNRSGRSNKSERGGQSTWAIYPDLLIVDGGKGQLSAAVGALETLDLGGKIQIFGLAKQQEELFRPGVSRSIMLPRDSEGLYLVQRIRDEAHRFAITFHRERRSKAAIKSALDDIPGIGPTRKKTLLKHFGTVKRISQASIEELISVPGITLGIANKLKENL